VFLIGLLALQTPISGSPGKPDEVSMRSHTIRLLAIAALAALFSSGGPAEAKPGVCRQLKAQLAGTSQTQLRATRRYDVAIAKQRTAMQQSYAMARRYRCAAGAGAPICGKIGANIRAQKRNLARYEAQKRRVVQALYSDACAGTPRERPKKQRTARSHEEKLYRTVCVRTCDGYFFPVSFSTTANRFDEDASACSARGGALEHQLFSLKLPDQTLEDAVSIDGHRYSDLPNALRYQRELVDGCSTGVRQASAMADQVAQERENAEGEGKELVSSSSDNWDPSRAYRRLYAVPGSGEDAVAKRSGRVEVNAPMRMARSDVRDVLKHPWVDPETMDQRDLVASRSYPPLPPSRPGEPEPEIILTDAHPPLPPVRPEPMGATQLSSI
jgi:hypothetical protein